MVALLLKPADLEITNEQATHIYALLRTWGAMTPDEVAAELRLDEVEVALYLANEAGLERLGYAGGCYVVRG